MRLSPLVNARAHSHRRPPAILLPPTLTILLGRNFQVLLEVLQAMRTVSLLTFHILGPLLLQERKTHLRNLELANPTAHHTRAQALLQKSQKARLRVAMALRAQDHLVRRTPLTKANPTVEVASHLQAGGLLVHRVPSLEASLTVEAVPLLQVVHLLVHQTHNLKVTQTAKAAHRLQSRVTRQQQVSNPPLDDQWHTIANQKLGLPDRR